MRFVHDLLIINVAMKERKKEKGRSTWRVTTRN